MGMSNNQTASGVLAQDQAASVARTNTKADTPQTEANTNDKNNHQNSIQVASTFQSNTPTTDHNFYPAIQGLFLSCLIALVLLAFCIIYGMFRAGIQPTIDRSKMYFAASILAFLGFVFILSMLIYAFQPPGSSLDSAGRRIFDTTVNVIPPMITLIIGFYFGTQNKKNEIPLENSEAKKELDVLEKDLEVANLKLQNAQKALVEANTKQATAKKVFDDNPNDQNCKKALAEANTNQTDAQKALAEANNNQAAAQKALNDAKK